MTRHTLGIVLPVLNEGAALARHLRALQPLRKRGALVVVVDGGSTDTTWAIAQQALGSLTDTLILAPRGRAAQMNAGAKVCQNHPQIQTLLFLHADTQLPPEADKLIQQAMDAGARWGRFDVHIRGRHPMLRVIGQMMNWRSRLTGIATGDQALFVQRRTFDAVGGFAPLPLMEDIDLSQRLKCLGPPACLREQVSTSGRRWEQHGLWRTVWLMWRLRAAYALGASASQLAEQYGYTAAPADAPPNAPVALAIVAKAPIAGLAKTRLIPALGPGGAARAQRRFVLNSLHTAQATVQAAADASAKDPAVGAAWGPVTLWCAPDATHRFFRALQRSCRTAPPLALQLQPQGDLGQRMLAAFEAHFSSQTASPSQAVLLIGTDCPVLSPGHLQAAALALQTHDVVLIPAEDGGYVLIGMRRCVPEAFANIAWSTPQVLAQTRERLHAAGASVTELAPLWDVDEPADWQRLHNLLHDSV